jgi:Tol biopolymer transport system component
MKPSPRIEIILLCIAGLFLTAFSACSPSTPVNAPSPGSAQTPAPSPIALAPASPSIFVFSSNLPDGHGLYRADTSLESIQPLSDLPAGGSCPAFSPDGTHLAFCSKQDGKTELYLADSNGANPRRLSDQLAGCGCSPDAHLAWSPDGKWISLPVGEGDNSQPGYDIYVVSVSDGQAINLTNSPQRYGGLLWDPDNQSLLFSGTLDGKADIYRVNIRDQKIAPLSGSPITGAASDWSPDGKKLLYYADSGGGNFDIFLLPEDVQPVRLTDAAGFDSYPAWFPDGQKILFVSERDGNKEIYVMNADGSNQTNLTNNPGSMDVWPSLSPDGSKIIYLTYLSNQWDSWIMNPDGTDKRKATGQLGIPSTIAWRP